MSPLAHHTTGLVDWSQPSLHLALVSIVVCPLFWNVMARCSPLDACYALACAVFILGFVRDYLVDVALQSQGRSEFLDVHPIQMVAKLLVVVGTVLVLSAFYRLGITGTYMGDYFGILLDERVRSFPFNLMNNPMYNGSSMIFLGSAMLRHSAVGILLSMFIFAVYRGAAAIEGPFTNYVYEKRKQDRAPPTPTSSPSTAALANVMLKAKRVFSVSGGLHLL